MGNGGINIDGGRIEGELPDGRTRHVRNCGAGSSYELPDSKGKLPSGRFPANLILSEQGARELDLQSGVSKSIAHRNKPNGSSTGTFGMGK